jgi:hypothetical protein
MRGEYPEGRFNINHERQSIIGGTTRDVVRMVGYKIEWWLYRQDLTVVDDIYDVGHSSGGRIWDGPHHINVINATLTQGVTMQNEMGLYNTDVLDITINMDVIDGSSLSGGETLPVPELRYLPSNPDAYLRDRIVFKNQVFRPQQILPKGIITNDYTLFGLQCVQVNPEELVNDPQFSAYASYSPYGNRGVYAFGESREGIPPNN